MSNPFVNFLDSAVDGSGNLRDYQHASRLYVSNTFELAPKAGWIYYVVLNINPDLSAAIQDSKVQKQFDQWQNKFRGRIGLLAKTVDLPKFTIETETLNQYNKKTVIQKSIKYTPISFSFHDDMANATTDLWKHYYQYYFADSINPGQTTVPLSILPKYIDSKYTGVQSRYGLNNLQTIPFFISIDVYQLHKQHYTSFKIVNPMISAWDHDTLDQSQGNKIMASKMTVNYETIIYNTDSSNKVTLDTPGFAIDHYDNTPSPLSIGGQGTNSLLGQFGVLAGADDILGDLGNLDNASPLDLLNTAIKGGNLIKNVKSMSAAGLKQEGYSILTGALGNISASPAGVVNTDGTISRVPSSDRISNGVNSTVAGVLPATNSLGINLSKNSNPAAQGQTSAGQVKL